MKAIYISVLIFLLMISVIIINRFYIIHVMDTVLEYIPKTTDITEKNIETHLCELRRYWSRKKDIVSISVNSNEISKVTEYIDNMILRASQHNYNEYKYSESFLTHTIQRIKDLESVSVYNII